MSLPATSVGLLLFALGAYVLLSATALRDRLSDRTRTGILFALVAVAFVGHAELLQRGEAGRVTLRAPPPHLHEFFHYYIGTKYFAELGHTGLYAATVLADWEDEPARFRPGERVRNLTTNVPEARAVAATEGLRVKQRFSAPRWQAFKRDVALIRDANPPDLWDRRGYVMDHGYNGTPLTTWILGGLAQQDMVATGTYIGMMRWLDPYLLVLAGMLVIGFEGAAVGLSFLFFAFANPLNDYAFVGGAYLRYGYLLALAGAVLAMRRGFGASAGALLAVATGLRLFPIVFYVALILHALLRPDRMSRIWGQRRLHAGFATASLLILAVASYGDTPDGRWAWLGFADNIVLHSRTPAANLVGLRTPFAYATAKDLHPPVDENEILRPHREGFNWVAETERVLAERRGPHAAALAIALLAAVWWLRRVPEQEALLPAFALLFTLLPLGHYYWSMLCLVPLALPERRDLNVGLAVVCAAFVAIASSSFLNDRLDLKFTLLSLGLAAFLVFAAFRTIHRTAPLVAAVALAATGCSQPPPIIDGNVWRSRALGASIEKPGDWVFLSTSSLRYDATARILDRGQLWERLDRPGLVPLISLASNENPIPGRDALLHLYVIPIRAKEKPFGIQWSLALPADRVVNAFVHATSGREDGFEIVLEPWAREIAGIPGAAIDARYRTHENGTVHPTRERMAHLKRAEEFWYVRLLGPDPFQPALEAQFESILASLRLED